MQVLISLTTHKELRIIKKKNLIKMDILLSTFKNIRFRLKFCFSIVLVIFVLFISSFIGKEMICYPVLFMEVWIRKNRKTL